MRRRATRRLRFNNSEMRLALGPGDMIDKPGYRRGRPGFVSMRSIVKVHLIVCLDFSLLKRARRHLAALAVPPWFAWHFAAECSKLGCKE